MAVKSTQTQSNILCRSPDTAFSTSTRQLLGDGVISTSGPMVIVCSPSDTQANALRLTDTEFQIFCNLKSNGLSITPTSLSGISGLTGNVESRLTNNQTSITALNTKTANMTASGATATYTGTHAFNSAMSLSTGQTFQINGTGRIFLNGTTSYIQLGTSRGILATGDLATGILINGTELSYLNNATSNIQDQFTAVNGSITTLNNKTTQITYTPIPAPLTTIANQVNISGKILLSTTTSSIELGSSLGILTTGTTYISPTELSMLDGATSNIPTAITNINNNLTDLNLKTTEMSYNPVNVTTTFGNVVNFDGTIKTTGTTWADGPIKLKTAFVAPVSGELGHTVTSLLNTGVISFAKSTVRSILNINLTIGVWIITYNAYINFATAKLLLIGAQEQVFLLTAVM
jgi:hypothetical protein